jgi:RNA polymerase sigma-70 factor (ECF subfamily)
LFGIARNVLREQFLVQTSDLPLDDELTESESSGATDEADLLCEFERKEKLEHLQKCILALPEEYREALVFCELEEMSYAEAAAALGCQPGTVASRLHRARAMLKSRMKKVGCLQ